MLFKKYYLLSACLISFSAFASLPPINIGTLYNTQGAQAALDQPSLRGAQLAVTEINAKGGVLGRKLRLLEGNGESKILKIQSVAKALSSNASVSVVIGLSDNDMVKAAAPEIIKAGKVFISSGATSPNLLLQFPQRFFLTAFTDNTQAGAAAQFAIKQMHRQRGIVLYQQNMAYTRDLAHYLITAFKHFSGKVLYKHAIVAKTLLPTTLTAIRKANVNVIFLAAGPSMAPKLIQQLRHAGIKQPIFGGDSYVATDIISEGKQVANDIYFTTHGYFDKDFMDDDMLAFIKAYKKKYGERPHSIFTALGYDAVQLAVAGIRKAGSTNPQRIATAIKKMQDFSALTGSLDLAGATPIKTVAVVKIIHAKARIAALVIPQYVPKPILSLQQAGIKSTVDLQHSSSNVTGSR